MKTQQGRAVGGYPGKEPGGGDPPDPPSGRIRGALALLTRIPDFAVFRAGFSSLVEKIGVKRTVAIALSLAVALVLSLLAAWAAFSPEPKPRPVASTGKGEQAPAPQPSTAIKSIRPAPVRVVPELSEADRKMAREASDMARSEEEKKAAEGVMETPGGRVEQASRRAAPVAAPEVGRQASRPKDAERVVDGVVFKRIAGTDSWSGCDVSSGGDSGGMDGLAACIRAFNLMDSKGSGKSGKSGGTPGR